MSQNLAMLVHGNLNPQVLMFKEKPLKNPRFEALFGQEEPNKIVERLYLMFDCPACLASQGATTDPRAVINVLGREKDNERWSCGVCKCSGRISFVTEAYLKFHVQNTESFLDYGWKREFFAIDFAISSHIVEKLKSKYFPKKKEIKKEESACFEVEETLGITAIEPGIQESACFEVEETLGITAVKPKVVIPKMEVIDNNSCSRIPLGLVLKEIILSEEDEAEEEGSEENFYLMDEEEESFDEIDEKLSTMSDEEIENLSKRLGFLNKP